MQDKHNRPARRRTKAAIASALCAGILTAQSAAQPSQQAAPPPSQQAAPQTSLPAAPPAANLNQLMRGLFFPNSNVIFLTQRLNPAEIKKAPEPSTATDPLTGVFGGWEAVQNSALILTDAADLLMTPGRQCSNGREAPVANADWVKFVNQLRDAGVVAYKAALSKDQETLDKATDVLNTSCQNCHNKYRARTRCQ